MAGDKAYCVELNRALSLREAHFEYFARPEAERRRFLFECPDEQCRLLLHPKVAAALYDRADAFGATGSESGRRRSPYFASLNQHPHRVGCDWHELPPASAAEGEEGNIALDPIVNTPVLGLIFRPEAAPPKVVVAEPQNGDDQSSFVDEDEVDDPATGREGRRPDSTRFISEVAQRYLAMTPHERLHEPLQIRRNGERGTFASRCVSVSSLDPVYQGDRVYWGEACVEELDFIFSINFKDSVSIAGVGSAKDTFARLKFVKSQIENDLELIDQLKKWRAKSTDILCFFYTEKKLEVRTGRDGVKRIYIDVPNHKFFYLCPAHAEQG